MSYRVGTKIIRSYLLDGTTYNIEITFKRMKSIILRYGKKEGWLSLSAPYYSSLSRIDEMVTSHLPKLLKKRAKRSDPLPYGEGWVYLLGEKVDLAFNDADERETYLKKLSLRFIEERVRYYEKAMGVTPPYRVRTAKLKSRYGSNSRRTHKLSFASSLIHYPAEVIDSVVVHELAHHFVFDHSKSFYNVVLRYCPAYWEMHKRLRKKIYERETD